MVTWRWEFKNLNIILKLKIKSHQALREKKSPTYRQRTLKEFKVNFKSCGWYSRNLIFQNMMHLEKAAQRGGLGPQAAPEHEVAKVILS